MLLSAIVVMAIVGGAVAFKVVKADGDLYQCESGFCRLADNDFQFTTSGGIVVNQATLTFDDIDGFNCNPFCDDQIRVKAE